MSRDSVVRNYKSLNSIWTEFENSKRSKIRFDKNFNISRCKENLKKSTILKMQWPFILHKNKAEKLLLNW